MKKTAMTISFAILSIVAFGVAACGNNAKAEDSESKTAMNQEGHDAHEGHDMEAAKDKAPVKNGFDGLPAPGTKAFCPVMKNDFEVKANSQYSEYKGKTYVFCCPGCKPTFEENPEKFI